MFNPLVILLNMASGSFGKAADYQIGRLDAGFQKQVRAWLYLCRVTLNLQVLIVSGRRTYEEQVALHRKDARNPLPTPGKPDIHMRGLAVDVNFSHADRPQAGQVLLKGSPVADWQAVYVLAYLCGIGNGANFKGYPDRNHFFKL